MMEAWPAPAKLNLFLHITGRRADGFHTLQSVFQFLDYHDDLSFDLTDNGQVTRAMPVPGIAEENDLTVRAARLLQQYSQCPRGAVIHLTKRLPAGAGLGGGSSDAATTLLALNHLWGCGLDLDTLAVLGLQLGADVPVFVRGQAAWAEGVGEQLTLIDLPEPWYLVLAPPVAVSTARAFAAFDAAVQLTPASPPITIRGFRDGRGQNDLESVVRRLYPEVDKALTWLGKFGPTRMTGSGACVFVPVENEARGLEILQQCPAGLADGFVARGVNRHPVHRRLYGE